MLGLKLLLSCISWNLSGVAYELFSPDEENNPSVTSDNHPYFSYLDGGKTLRRPRIIGRAIPSRPTFVQ